MRVIEREQALKQQATAAAASQAAEDDAAKAALKAAIAELARKESELAERKAAKASESRTYSVVPYKGKNGEDRRPLYVECAGRGVVFHPDGGEMLQPLDPRDLQSELQRQIAGQKQAVPRQPYFLLLVRPDGTESYWALQATLRRMDIDFGYELIDADWVLDFPADESAPSQWTAEATPVLAPGAAPTGPKPRGLPPQGNPTASLSSPLRQVAGGYVGPAQAGEGGMVAPPGAGAQGLVGSAGANGSGSSVTDGAMPRISAGNGGTTRSGQPAGTGANGSGPPGSSTSGNPNSTGRGTGAPGNVDGAMPGASGGQGGNGGTTQPSQPAGAGANGGGPPGSGASGNPNGTGRGTGAPANVDGTMPGTSGAPTTNAGASNNGYVRTDATSVAPGTAPAPPSPGTNSAATAGQEGTTPPGTNAAGAGPAGTSPATPGTPVWLPAGSTVPPPQSNASGGSGRRAELGDIGSIPIGPPDNKRRDPQLRPMRLTDRNWVIFVECRSNSAMLYPSQMVFSAADLNLPPAVNPLLAAVKKMIVPPPVGGLPRRFALSPPGALRDSPGRLRDVPHGPSRLRRPAGDENAAEHRCEYGHSLCDGGVRRMASFPRKWEEFGFNVLPPLTRGARLMPLVFVMQGLNHDPTPPGTA